MGKVVAVCTSPARGTEKENVGFGRFTPEWGLVGDAHGGDWHRQVSLLSADKIAAFNEKGAKVHFGAFGENLVVEGVDFRALPVGTRLRCGTVVLELTQLGKDCHSHCAIYQRMGECIMPRQGVFARVLEGGDIAVGDELSIESRRKGFDAAVITLSDKGFSGERADESGKALAARLEQAGYRIIEHLLLPDGIDPLRTQLIRLCDQRQPDLILTTGGTGFSPRDLTPEATLAAAERLAPGIAEAIRAHSMTITPRAMLSRGVSVLRGRTLIVNLPGSVRAVEESLDCFLPVLPHALEVLRGDAGDCGGTVSHGQEASSAETAEKEELP
ncbi:MOSC domain-containing protein [Oscillibacter sp.]|uniref:MOSC domain-containing protein n=1 Tax=Oscillibacter sp. TaxID=1945593 RepID=UPI00262A7D29|nr:MOSC domain-containing protein [Oscillibacter sp.]MDD3346581.1 molybdopterin-binding protein [Oscillibacter sp.]